MTKNVVIVSLVIFISSCSFYGSNTRDVDRCVYAIANPITGTVNDAVFANEVNFKVNKPHCDDQFDQLGIE